MGAEGKRCINISIVVFRLAVVLAAVAAAAAEREGDDQEEIGGRDKGERLDATCWCARSGSLRRECSWQARRRQASPLAKQVGARKRRSNSYLLASPR